MGNQANLNHLTVWHDSCKARCIAAGWSGSDPGVTIMIRFQSASRVVASFVGALFFAAVFVGAAVPVMPIA